MNKKKVAVGASLIAIVGFPAASLLWDYVPEKEGVVTIGYLDPVGIPTKCMGDTNDVIVGKPYTIEECYKSLERELVVHAKGVLRCTPILKDYPKALMSSVSFAYNFGITFYCNSQPAKNFNKGDWVAACRSFNESTTGQEQYVFAGCKVVYDFTGNPVIENGKIKKKCTRLKGLVTRRAEERKFCEQAFNIGAKPNVSIRQ